MLLWNHYKGITRTGQLLCRNWPSEAGISMIRYFSITTAGCHLNFPLFCISISNDVLQWQHTPRDSNHCQTAAAAGFG